jgi:hypothetical protein
MSELSTSASIDDVLGRLEELQKQREIDSEAAFEEMVRAANDDGLLPPVEAIAQTLRDAGKSSADFHSAIEVRRQRLQWRADIETADIMAIELRDVSAKIRAENERFANLAKEHQETIAPLAQWMHKHSGQGSDLRNKAMEGLKRTAPRRILDRLAELAEEKRNLYLTGKQFHDNAQRLRASIKAMAEMRESSKGGILGHAGDPIAAAEKRAKETANSFRIEEEAAAEDAKADELQPRLDLLAIEEAGLERAKLEP